MLALPDGRTADIPIEIWKFSSLSDCSMSVAYLNTGKTSAAHNYGCVEADPVRLAVDLTPKSE
jgi:hypothetical protein